MLSIAMPFLINPIRSEKMNTAQTKINSKIADDIKHIKACHITSEIINMLVIHWIVLTLLLSFPTKFSIELFGKINNSLSIILPKNNLGIDWTS
ncbi:hypothetical protein KAU32_06330 [bacterium]|nr:hypothetical protein [bacterium]